MRNYAGTAMMLLITMGAAIGSYTVNLRVSAERAAVAKLQRQLVADAREIRTLQVELRTRARFPEMQRWNDGVFQMSAPAAGQFLRNPVQLASFGAAPVPDAGGAAPAIIHAVTRPEASPLPAAATDRAITVGYVSPRRPAPAASPTPPETARLIRAGFTASRPVAPIIVVPDPAGSGPIELIPEVLPDGGQ